MKKKKKFKKKKKLRATKSLESFKIEEDKPIMKDLKKKSEKAMDKEYHELIHWLASHLSGDKEYKEKKERMYALRKKLDYWGGDGRK